jgi:hypothetical protein
MRNIIVDNPGHNSSHGTIRWALAQSEKEAVRITFNIPNNTIDFSDVYYEAGDQDAKRVHHLEIEEESEGVEIIGPITFRSITFELTRVAEPVLFENVRIRVGTAGYGPNINTDCVFAEKCDELTFRKCSFSYSNDECLSFNKCGEIYFDRCIFGPPLHIPMINGEYMHKEGSKGSHGYLFRSSVCDNIEIRRCILTDASRRNPQINNEGIKKGKRYEMLVKNSLIFNYKEGFTYNSKPDQDEEDSRITVDLDYNYFIPGPRTAENSQEINLEESKDTEFRVKNIETNKIAHRAKFTVRNKDDVYQVDSGEGPTNRYEYMLEKGFYGCQPNDDVDREVTRRIRETLNNAPVYDNLDEKNFHKRWPESDWINNA